jgi:hypothetical protein
MPIAEASVGGLMKSFIRPPAIAPIREESDREAALVCVLTERHCLPVNRNGAISATVVVLLNSGGPAAILRRVRSVVVKAVKGIPRWARPHVRQERTEIIPPAVAHNDAAATVQPTFMVREPIAASFSLAPHAVFAHLSTGCCRSRAISVAGTRAEFGLKRQAPRLKAVAAGLTCALRDDARMTTHRYQLYQSAAGF